MYKYCVYGIYENNRFTHYLSRFDEFSEAEEYLHSCYTEHIYNFDGYLIKYEWCW